jgi:hypothetical protein
MRCEPGQRRALTRNLRRQVWSTSWSRAPLWKVMGAYGAVTRLVDILAKGLTQDGNASEGALRWLTIIVQSHCRG